MSLHHASERWRLGLLLALITAFCWATLPIALKIVLDALDPVTVTWFRFLVAAVCTVAWLALRGQLGGYARLGRRGGMMLAIAALMLIGNYLFYLLGVQYTTPANAQLLIQLAPLLMTLGGIWLFRERFARIQWLGLGVLVLGMALFFRDQLMLAAQAQTQAASQGGSAYVFGSLLVVISAVVWAAYALLQKQLLTRLGSMQILLVIYIVASIVLLPFAQPAALLALDRFHWVMLIYCALNTVGAYGAFAEALAHWEASRVSAVLATTPLLCIVAAMGVHAVRPAWLAAERITILGWAGAGLVVLGSAAVSLLGRVAKPAAR